MADDLEVAFGDRIVRLDGTVVECFGLGGFFTGTRIPVNFLGVTVKQKRNGDLEVGLGWRDSPYDATSSADVLDDQARVLAPVAILMLSATQWPKLQPLLIEAAKRRTLSLT
jgi:hypothetical protein